MDGTGEILPGAPVSPLLVVLKTTSAGRAVFATTDVAKDTVLWAADSPSVDVILREYRRELCATCFAYNRGREWKIRDNSVGFAFCSAACQRAWMDFLGDDGVEAWRGVEKLSKGCSRDRIMDDVGSPAPDQDEIEAAWSSTFKTTTLIRAARANKLPLSKPARRALASVTQAPASPDVLSLLLSGILARRRDAETWASILAVCSNRQPYKSLEELKEHIKSFLQLLVTLPPRLLPYATPETCYAIATRDSMNSFGIRSLDDGGAEFFGYGLWTSASYFNHSCAPNVRKIRVGRTWHFTADRDIRRGEELCITYLGAEESGLMTNMRRKLLAETWGFRCNCDKCTTSP